MAGVNYETAPRADKSVLPAARPDDFGLVEEFLSRLARAAKRLHTYPADSPLCAKAIAECRAALAGLERRDGLTFRVTPGQLIVDDLGVGRGTIIERELVHRLHRARVASVDIDAAASERHLTCFCTDLHRCEDITRAEISFADLLLEHGVDAIAIKMADRPAVFEIGTPSAPVRELIDHEQQRQRQALAAGGRLTYLYPPDKAWVRLDPNAPLRSVSLIDLALLVDDPATLAGMLLHLTDGDSGGGDEGKTPLERKFSDVATLFAALDPRLARVMFKKLARSVLELGPGQRTELLRRTILPGLLDGRADGAVLSDFPDVDLADSLCLLLELETAAPELLTAALNRLDLSKDRREAVIPLIDKRLHTNAAGKGRHDRSGDSHIDRFARRLINIDAATTKDFSEFTAFDLSIDDETRNIIDSARQTIDTSDALEGQLSCLTNLVRLEPNPTVVEGVLRRVIPLFVELEHRARWADLAAWALRYRDLADALRGTRPDIAEAIGRTLSAFYVPARASALADLHERDTEGRQLAAAVVEAFGVAMVPGLLALLDDKSWQAKAAAVVALMCDHARLLAPALARQLRQGGAARRPAIRVLGFAGAGHEGVLSEQLERGDEQTFREALRALARIGTGQAASIVARQLEAADEKMRAAAEEALWHLPPTRAAVQVRQLLGRRDFVVQHPDIATSLLVHAANAGTDGLDEVLARLEPLRFRFWNPALMRVARKARELRVQ